MTFTDSRAASSLSTDPERMIPAQACRFSPFPSCQTDARWTTWCFSFCWLCGGNPGSLWWRHQLKDWANRNSPRTVKVRWLPAGLVYSRDSVNVKDLTKHLRNSRWSSRPAPGCVWVIRSKRRARGTGGGVESIRASARHSSPSLLFCKSENIH